MNSAPSTSPGVISASDLYTLAEIESRLKLGKRALRTARKQGLIVRKIGRRGYILGSDLIDWFAREAKAV